MSHNRITKQHKETIKKYQLNIMQESIYKSLLQAQVNYPKLTNAQYALFLTLYKEIQRNKTSINYGKTRNINS